MPSNLFEYAVIRVVPRVEREEFINVGVALYCKNARYLDVRIHLDEPRLLCLSPHADVADIRDHLQAFENIARGIPEAGPIAILDAAARFRWLTARRSTVIQTSQVHPGLCEQPDEALARLYGKLVAVE
jgi:hypothetical protein